MEKELAAAKAVATAAPPSSSESDDYELASLRASVQALEKMQGDGIEEVLAAKRIKVAALQAKKLQAKPAHIQVKNVEDRIKKKEQQHEKLQARLDKLNAERGQLEADLASATGELQELKAEKDKLLVRSPPGADGELGQAKALLALSEQMLAQGGGGLGDLAAPLDAVKQALLKQITEAQTKEEAMPPKKEEEETLDEEMPPKEELSKEEAELIDKLAASGSEQDRKRAWHTILRVGKKRRVVPAAAANAAGAPSTRG